MQRRGFLIAGTATAVGAAKRAGAQGAASPAPAQEGVEGGDGAKARGAGSMELALLADAPSTPTGLAISKDGRVFVMMPRFTAEVPYTLGEVAKDGGVTPYPDMEANRPDPKKAQARLFHVPNGVFDDEGYLWLLDAALPEGKGPPVEGGAKLVKVDLATNGFVQVVPLEPGIAETSSLNDLRVGRLNGRAVAFVTDQGQDGKGAVLAVDLANGRVVRRLDGHWSTDSSEGLVKFVEHRPVLQNAGGGPPQSPKGGANGIALSPDGGTLYYAPLMGRNLYAVPTEALLDKNAPDALVAAKVADLGEKGMTGGLGCDAEGRVYLTLQEQNAIGRRDPDGTIEVVAFDPRLIWADTIVITGDEWLYVSAAQVNRRPEYNHGKDEQAPPYAVLRVKIDAGPAWPKAT